MISRWSLFLLLLLSSVLLPCGAPGSAVAAVQELIVEHTPTDNNHFSTIQAALDHAAALLRNPNNTDSFQIKVQSDPVPYIGPVNLVSDVPIIGSSTGGTFIAGTGSGTLITGNNVSRVAIRNFTFLASAIGISIVNGSNIDITNNVFALGRGATAVQVQNSTLTTIVNNTFYNNGTAISTTSDVTISNDIFSTNTTAIATGIPLTGLSYCDFFNNGNNGVADLGPRSIPSTAVPIANPLFVDPVNRDFHLESDSPAKGSGNPKYPNSFDANSSDMGAYGGPYSDKTVATVTGVTTALISPSTVSVAWDATGDRSVTAYRVYYGTASGSLRGTGAAEGPSPVEADAGSTHANLTGITVPAPATPAAPTVTGITPLNETLQITWTRVAGATAYRIYYSTSRFSTASLPPNPIVMDGSATTAKVTGLANGTPYFIAVAAVAQPKLFVSVTAVRDTSIASDPGGTNESPLSTESSQQVGEEKAGPISNLVSDFPEAVSPYPDLKSGGCFIATAAYGFYSAPQVQALRRFRDHFLMNNGPGRAFVAWYYAHSPRAAAFINAHPWLKPPVRVLLLPLVATSLLIFYSTGTTKIALAFGAFLLMVITKRTVLCNHLPLLKAPPPLQGEGQGRDGFTVAGGTPIPLLASPVKGEGRAGPITSLTNRHRAHKKGVAQFLVIFFLLLTPSVLLASDQGIERPHWSLELKGGVLFPDLAKWSKFYGSSYVGEYGGALAYKVLRQLEVGLEGSYSRSKGKGAQVAHGQVADSEVTFQRAPLNVFLLLRGILNEDQWLVPYVGGGYTRMFYREEVEGQGKRDGSVNGFHVRGGVQLLLDRLEPGSAASLSSDFGLRHSYFVVEGKYTRAMADTVAADSVNVGGSSCSGGFLFEF